MARLGSGGLGRRLVICRWPGNVGRPVHERFHRWLPWVFAGVMALTRWPGLMPPNFSAVYAFVFCAGALLPGSGSWRLPLGVMVGTDLLLNLYYQFGRGWEVLRFDADLGAVLGMAWVRECGCTRLSVSAVGPLPGARPPPSVATLRARVCGTRGVAEAQP